MKNGWRMGSRLGLLAAAVFAAGTCAFAEGETLQEQEIYSQDGLKVTVTGLEESFLGTEVKLLLENEGDRDIGVQASYVSVNDYMAESSMSVELGAGKRANDSLLILTSDFAEKGIDTIAKIEFCLHLFDPEEWTTLADSEPIRLVTEGNEEYVQEYDDSGEVLYEKDGLKIVSKGIREDDFFGQELALYVENLSDRDVVIQADSTSVNDFMIDAIMSIDLLRGKRALDGMTFLQSYLDDNGIETIEEIETVFHIADPETYMTIEDTDVIRIRIAE